MSTIVIEEEVDARDYDTEMSALDTVQGEEFVDLSIAGEPLNIYEILILICQRGQNKVDDRGTATHFHKKGPSGRGKPAKAKYPTGLKDNPIRLKVHAATAEMTRQFLSVATDRRVIYVPQHGGLRPHKTLAKGEVDTHGSGIAWDHGDYRKISPPAAPTFFYSDNNSALTTRQLVAAVAVLCDQGVLPEGRLGFYGTKHVINNMHYDFLFWKKQNSSLFKKIDNRTMTGGSVSGWYWHNKKKVLSFPKANSMQDNLQWVKKNRPKNKSIDEILDLYSTYSNVLQGNKIITLEEYLSYLEEREANANSWVKMKKIT
tara:strand:- start:9779 stop:10726 length:948 start_codon:yes stop_codon:yes gene_type:complete